MKITEKWLLDNYEGTDPLGTNDSKGVFWCYRKEENADRSGMPCLREEADIITLEIPRKGIIEISAENDNHEKIGIVRSAFQKLFGDEIDDEI